MSTVPESHRSLLDLPITTLATVGPDGRPQLSAVWFLVDEVDGDQVFKVSLNTSRQKTKNLLSNPVIALFFVDVANPMRYLEVRGDAQVDADDDYEFADRVGAKYGGADLRQMDGPGESRVVVTVRPSRVNAVDMGG